MNINRATIKNLFNLTNFSKFFLILWLSCVLGVLAIITIATNGFTTQVSDTTIGQSDMWIPIFLLLFLTGCAAFGGLSLCIAIFTLRKIFTLKISDKKQRKEGKSILEGLLILVVMILMFLIGRYSGLEKKLELEQTPTPTPSLRVSPTPKLIQTIPKPQTQPKQTTQQVTWGGPELWKAVNKRRVELGVNPLNSKGEFCTIAAIRLNELLELGKLDAHEGFGNMPERRSDLKWIFDKYNVYEFLIAGIRTPEEAVAGWEHTLGHRSLLAGGEFVWGCIYAARGFAVAIAAF